MWERRVWTAGCGLFLLHVISAFHFYHDWSHDAAYRATAKQTAEVIGWNWGGGLYFNYLFTAAWLAEVVVWWAVPGRFANRSRIECWTSHLFFALIMFNATVVFGPSFWKWLGGVACLSLVALAWHFQRHGKR